MERDQKVWVWQDRKGIQQTTIKSCGRKYIRTNLDDRIRFDVNILTEIDSHGYASFIILDLEKYQKDAYYTGLRWKIKDFNWNKVTRENLDKIAEILELPKRVGE
jgi:hypothetical protein